MIGDCLERQLRVQVRDVSCNIKLGLGLIYLNNEDDKNFLLNSIKKIIIEPSTNTIVSFVDELELFSYIVFETNDIKPLPSPAEISRQWFSFYKVKSEPKCEQLSIQFPNIFRITTYSFDELMETMSIKQFQINKQFATVYFRADCCFFEDLPRTTNYDRLKDAIRQQISDKCMSQESIYIQYNKESANAVVLTSDRARIWSLHNSIQLDGRIIMKKDELACRLLIENVPNNLSPSTIENHKIFSDCVVKIVPNNEHIILELSNRDVHEKCVNQGTLRIGNHELNIKNYIFSNNPENSEIDAETWYETEMCDHKSDITPFMSNPQHFIFQWKWNSQAFLDQFHQWTSHDQNSKDKNEKLCNHKRHLLRMTVMLNTIGVIKKGYYRIGEKQNKINSNLLKTILYDHKSKLEQSKTISLIEIKRCLYPSTKVRVVNDDCLIVYQQLVNQGYKPVILNMANATSPGGGYKRGDGAQEETLFRRSNYYQSLDLTLDDNKPTARYYCTSNTNIERLDHRKQLYPIDEYGAIYTSGLTVFRSPEDTGYEFMDRPMDNVCAIAMPAYRDPKLENKNFLSSKFSIGTRKKIESIFAIAYQHKHDCLVLSALGCGAFRNPPTHIASIFKSVIEQYAGFFKCIYFSVLDDHNTGQDLNPIGNFIPFRNLLDNLNIELKPQITIDTMIGPWRILNQTKNKEITLSDIRIYYLTPCRYGGKCETIKNEQHCREFSHPPLCPYTDSTIPCREKNDEQHLLWYRHRQKCLQGGECEVIENDRIHLNEFEHPEFCRDGGKCENIELDHLKSYRHLPLCRYRRECSDFKHGSYDHCQNFRHLISMCPNGAYCTKFNDEKHFNEEKHPFRPPCSLTPFHCQYFTDLSTSKNTKSLPTETLKHCSQYSHVCRFGRNCREKATIHWNTTIHIPRYNCPDGDQCTKLRDENHLNSFSHPKISDIRRLCIHLGYKCPDRQNPDHIIQYRHQGNHARSDVISCFGQNRRINFVENQENMLRAINDYVKKPFTVPAEIRKFIKGLQPVHRCGKVIFESILVHGHVMSREYMEHLNKPSYVAQAVLEHKRVRAIINRPNTSTVEHAKEYIRAIVSREYRNKSNPPATAPVEAYYLTPTVTAVPDDFDETIRTEERFLKNMLQPEQIDTIKNCAIDIAEASWNVNNLPNDLGHPPDRILDTNKYVFSTLGPNLGHYYGDIIIVFKSELMLHPDANFSTQAATSFLNGRAYINRPWAKNPTNTHDQVKCFHQSKLHCSIPEYEYAAAAELVGVISTHKKSIADIQIKDLFNRWKKTDLDEVFEAHLPQLIPLDYIEEIYIPKNLFASLTPAVQQSAKNIFGTSLHITHHSINLKSFTSRGQILDDKSRVEYQDFVVDKLIEKFKKRMENTSHLYGTVITLAPSQFTNHIVLPTTISGAYSQYRQTHKHSSNFDVTYIYWEAMYGDMMLTLSNEEIDSYINQPHLQCLVVYVAERPSITTTSYNESYSYINADDPCRHDDIMKKGRCAARSRLFYRGCNIEDFFTYCLKIERKTGEVTLSHAGPNGIYCYETISHQFSQSKLDLSKLNYIHVSAGSQKVPIRNLIVSFEQISDLHPTVDKSYKQNNDSIAPIRPSQAHDRKPSPSKIESPDDKSPSLIYRAFHVVGNLIGYDMNGKKLPPCPHSANCLLLDDTNHMKSYLHPCPYGQNCPDKDKEPYLTHEPDEMNPSKDPVGQGKFRNAGRPEPHNPSRHTPSNNRVNHPHNNEQAQMGNDKKSGASYALALVTSTFSSQSTEKPSHNGEKYDPRYPCRHGSNCRDKNQPDHYSKYSHPTDQRRRDDKIPCKFGTKCYDTDPHHRSKYSHPHK